MFTVYAITSSSKIYIGQTANLAVRLKRHNGVLINNRNSYTSKNKKGGWELFYKEEFLTRQEAIRREKELKSYKGREFLRSLLKKK